MICTKTLLKSSLEVNKITKSKYLPVSTLAKRNINFVKFLKVKDHELQFVHFSLVDKISDH